MFLKKIIIVSIIFLFSFSLVVPALAGFGISPPWVRNKNLLPGTSFEETIYLVQKDPDTELYIKAEIESSEIENWIKIDNGNDFKIPRGVNQFPMKVKIFVPDDAIPGNYSGKISLSTYSKNDNNSGIAVKTILGAEVEVDLKVSLREFSSFSIQRFLLPDFEKGDNLKVLLKTNNSGNTDLSFSRIEVDIFDKEFNVLINAFKKEDFENIGPFETKEIKVEFPTKLEIGEYWAKIRIYKDGKFQEEEKLFFTILEKAEEKKGFVKASLEKNIKTVILEKEKTGNTTALLLLILIGVSVIVLAGSLYLSQKSIKN